MHGIALRLVQNMVLPTFVVDLETHAILWNAACERLTGLSAREAVLTGEHWRAFYSEPALCLADLIAQRREHEIEQRYRGMTKLGRTDFGYSLEIRWQLPLRKKVVDVAVDAGPIFDHSGRMVAVAETLRDITVETQLNHTLQSLATIDSLTALANRRSFDLALSERVEAAAASGAPVSLLMIDVDCFKAYNDDYGHQAGDRTLKAVAEAIRSVGWRPGDLAARYGGEEFAVLLPDCGGDRAERVSQRMLEVVADLAIPHRSSGISDIVTVSVGCATAEFGMADPAGLVAAADEALYRSKRRGRARMTIAGVMDALTLF